MASSEYDYFSWRILQIQIFDYLLNILNGFNESMKVLWLLVNNNNIIIITTILCYSVNNFIMK